MVNIYGKWQNGVGGIYGNINDDTSYLINLENCYTVGKIKSSWYKGIFGSRKKASSISLTNCYCNDSTINNIGDDATIVSNKLTENQMKNIDVIENGKKIIDLLNEYVDEYNETNKNNTDFIKLKNWEIGNNGYPTLIK